MLEFPEGITAIVGPNGSGKSNVVDAIRWLLGERDAKSLRGGKVEDLIFAGTPKRARVGQAQASLHFENIGKFFPVESAEVSVMRQVNRDGQSQYFLNKSEVLLRDLVGFYAKARMGSKGLIVVTQGNSDMFIQASPVARREMIEEMLGLREYQLKRADGLRRLKSTKINLDKAKALIEEITPHLRSLKRQTSRFEKRGALEAELASLERNYFGSEVAKLSAAMRSSKEQIASHADERSALEEKKKSALAHQAAVEAAEPEGRSMLRDVKAKAAATLGERSRIERDIARLEARIEAETRVNQKVAHAAHLPSHEDLVLLTNTIKQSLRDALGGAHEDLKKAVEGALSHIDSVFAEKAAPEQRSAAGEQELLAIRKDLEDLSASLSRLDESIKALREEESHLEKGQEDFMKVFKDAVSQVEAASRAIYAWEESNRQRMLESERLAMRFEELSRALAQAGKTPSDFENVSVDGDFVADAQMQNKIFRLRAELAGIGEIDEALIKEAHETEERYQFLAREAQDLERAAEDLKKLVSDLRDKIHGEFKEALDTINSHFETFFAAMFGGGSAKLIVAERAVRAASAEEGETATAPETDEDAETESGIEMTVALPRKRISSLEALSGGERSLVGIAALFALISVSPPPFLVLDEVDAPLDEKNARRFATMLRTFSKKTQFVLITHNRATMEAADVLYGVTLGEDGTSKVLSLKFEESAAHAR